MRSEEEWAIVIAATELSAHEVDANLYHPPFQKELVKIVHQIQQDAFAAGVKSTKTSDQFVNGSNSMARACLNALKLVTYRQWTLSRVEEWLRACLENDSKFYETAVDEISQKVRSTTEKMSE